MGISGENLGSANNSFKCGFFVPKIFAQCFRWRKSKLLADSVVDIINIQLAGNAPLDV